MPSPRARPPPPTRRSSDLGGAEADPVGGLGGTRGVVLVRPRYLLQPLLEPAEQRSEERSSRNAEPPRAPPSPYTPLFRSRRGRSGPGRRAGRDPRRCPGPPPLPAPAAP